MNTRTDRKQRYRVKAVASAASLKRGCAKSVCQFVDTRLEATIQRKLQNAANSSNRANIAAQLCTLANNASAQRHWLKKKYTHRNVIHGSMGQQKRGLNEAPYMFQQEQPHGVPSMQIADAAKSERDCLPAETGTIKDSAFQMIPTAHNKRLHVDSALNNDRNPIQRAIIAHAPIDGLTADIDTANRTASKAQIDEMWNAGKIGGLATLKMSLAAAKPENHPNNNRALRQYITQYLEKRREDDPNAGVAGAVERWWFDKWNPPGDETGITQHPGQADVLPVNPTALQTHALNVRSWQIGDIVDGVSWSTLGHHLQGRMSVADYQQLGDDILARRDLMNGTNLQATTANAQKVLIAQASLQRVSTEIQVGLNNLPTREGVSYRAATAAVGVYGNAINIGDYIKDMAFWSTSGLKLSHKGTDFGAEGTLATPKVYFIITGSTGVFVPRFTNKEAGVREVLFKDQTIFEVTKITNYVNRTFFVYVTEVDPATLPANQITKNPWSGTNNP